MVIVLFFSFIIDFSQIINASLMSWCSAREARRVPSKNVRLVGAEACAS